MGGVIRIGAGEGRRQHVGPTCLSRQTRGGGGCEKVQRMSQLESASLHSLRGGILSNN